MGKVGVIRVLMSHQKVSDVLHYSVLQLPFSSILFGRPTEDNPVCEFCERFDILLRRARYFNKTSLLQ